VLKVRNMRNLRGKQTLGKGGGLGGGKGGGEYPVKKKTTIHHYKGHQLRGGDGVNFGQGGTHVKREGERNCVRA